jgi:hypothetical protein
LPLKADGNDIISKWPNLKIVCTPSGLLPLERQKLRIGLHREFAGLHTMILSKITIIDSCGLVFFLF